MRGSAGRGGKKGAPLPHCPTAGPCGGLGFGLLSFPPPPPRCVSLRRPSAGQCAGAPLCRGCMGWEGGATLGGVP